MLKEKAGSKLNRPLALTAVTGAIACSACCVLPFALPAAMLAGFGGLSAIFAGTAAWMTGLAIISIALAWGWVGWQSIRLRRRPAPLTLSVMGAITMLTATAIIWS